MKNRLPFTLNERVASITPYVPGKPTDELERELGLSGTVKLASNENPLGPSAKAIRAVRKIVDGSHRYPDGGAFHLKQRLAMELKLPPECLVIGNGSTEIVEMLAKAFLPPTGAALVSEGAFIMYRIACLAASAEARSIPMSDDSCHDLPAMVGAVQASTRLLFVANPNNPTGTLINRSQLDAYFQALPDHVLTVVDEAYREYIHQPDYPNAVDDLRTGRRVVVLRTFSKIHGLAGLRIGYGIGPPDVIRALEKVRSPFNTNALGQVAAVAALDDPDHARRSREENAIQRERLQAAFTDRDLAFIPSSANFVLMAPGLPGKAAYQALLQRGVIVRPMDGYGFPEHVRVSVGRPDDNDRFLAALDAIREKRSPATA